MNGYIAIDTKNIIDLNQSQKRSKKQEYLNKESRNFLKDLKNNFNDNYYQLIADEAKGLICGPNYEAYCFTEEQANHIKHICEIENYSYIFKIIYDEIHKDEVSYYAFFGKNKKRKKEK